MAVNTILLDFCVDRSIFENDQKTEESITKVLANHIAQLSKIASRQMDDGGILLVYTGHRGCTVNVRGFVEGILSISIEYFRKASDEELITFKQKKSLEAALSKLLDSARSKVFPPIKRGGPIDFYLNSSDERILEYDIDNVLFEEQSPYQKVQIVHAGTIGNMLVLDGLQNLASKDLIYTETLMQRGKEDYRNKEIIILGGGDGALLYELLKESPKLVLMFELDEVVIRGCRTHMREVCGDVLDNLKGPNYEIILGDCMKSLDVMIKEGRKFDYVFGDLTDVPVSDEEHETWSFIKDIINISLKVMKPEAKYMTHCCGIACPNALKSFEEHLKKLDEPVEFSTDVALIPSFLEFWQFYQIWRKV
ncbi:Spermine/spermidine synthase [Nesidiocoris tenuis]|uniref:Spermine/spermidine synthase n=1 Tax=Nesidiocoris tenuis TaxID=355587 RepID=A0ABN7B9F8_9HEMI|nr:Spermine/spermidine synthase [Nesidiocoris tenuis]